MRSSVRVGAGIPRTAFKRPADFHGQESDTLPLSLPRALFLPTALHYLAWFGPGNLNAVDICAAAVQYCSSFVSVRRSFGHAQVDAGPLNEGWRIQRDTPGYGPRRTAEELRRDLAAAKRYADK